jgi:hypothetical protein
VSQNRPINLVEVFHHDVVVKEINGRQIMLVSYWDGGYVLLDVTNAAAATYIGDTDFANPDPEAVESGIGVVPPEGNAHQSEFTSDNKYVIAADEDFDPYAVAARDVPRGEDIFAPPGSDTPQLAQGQVIEGGSVFVGRACPGDAAVPPGNPAVVDVAVVERGVCLFTEKVAAVQAAGGYDAVLIFNREGSDACNGALSMSVAGNIPAFGVAQARWTSPSSASKTNTTTPPA